MDTALLRALNGLRSPLLDALSKLLVAWGYYAAPAVLIVALLLRRDRARAATARDGVLAWLLAMWVAEDFLKSLVARPRPTAVPALRASLRVLGRVPPVTSYSFPSGAATAAFAGAAWLWLRWGPRAGVPATILAVLIGLARVYAGVHYPSDVLGGAVVGVAVAYGVERFARWVARGA